MTRRMTLGTVVYGVGQTQSSWLFPGLTLDAEINFEHQCAIARQAEAACLDFLFIGDSPYCNATSWPGLLNRFEPITLLSALAAVTSRIGLIGSISTTFSEPYNVARLLASLDHLSKGRAGWNIVTTAHPDAAKNFGADPHLDHDVRYARAAEHLDVVRGLWDSWDEGAFVRDRETRRFFDPDKLHQLNHAGEHFSVAGPLCIERPPQGHPIIAQAGASAAGIEFAARNADVVFGGARSYEIASTQYRALKAAAKAAGRSPDQLIVMPGVAPIIGSTDEEAERRFEEIKQYSQLDEALITLKDLFLGHDFTRYDPDAPFPEMGDAGASGWQSRTNQIKRKAAEEKMTLRQVAMDQSIPRTDFIGSAERVADKFEEWFKGDAADGFILNVGSVDSLSDFIDQVLPILRRRGLFRETYAEGTFRDNLGLPRVPSRYAR